MEELLERAIAPMCQAPAPPKLAAAVRHVVLSGGSRVRPQLCLAVFDAARDSRDGETTGETFDGQRVAETCGIAIELLHCASLVHDDLPCFDDADLRRGVPTAHVLFGEPIAVLAGDALIVRAFEMLGAAVGAHPTGGALAFASVARAVGMPAGITAGQAWESEDDADIDLAAYHRAKTGALFVAACEAAAHAAGGDVTRWASFGAKIGQAYQVADDLKDTLLPPDALGKPNDQDARHGRPNAAAAIGVEAAQAHLFGHLSDAIEIATDARAARRLRQLVAIVGAKVLPTAKAAELAARADTQPLLYPTVCPAPQTVQRASTHRGVSAVSDDRAAPQPIASA